MQLEGGTEEALPNVEYTHRCPSFIELLYVPGQALSSGATEGNRGLEELPV